MPKSKLQLYYEENLVGELTETEQNQISFAYDSKWLNKKAAFSISNSLPLREEPYYKESQNYFANLLPEGDIRTAVCRRLGISNENDFRMLEALGGECAGAFTVGYAPLALNSDYEEISGKTIKKLLLQGVVLFSTLQNEKNDIRLSLAGAQDKIPVLFHDNKFFLPHGNSPTTHLLKLPSTRIKYLPENECLMSLFAKNMGLETATTSLIDLEKTKACLVERYDRIKTGKIIKRLHQEDYCQALAYSYKTKYEKDGGPSFSQCYQCTVKTSRHLPEDLDRLMRWLIYNVIIGNCDAHAKNISLLMAEPGEWKLSPHYDLVSTKIYPRITTKLAMSIGGAEDSGTVAGKHWEKIANEIKIGTKLLKQTVEEMAETSLDTYDETSKEFTDKYGKSPVIKHIREVIHTQRRRLLSQLKK